MRAYATGAAVLGKDELIGYRTQHLQHAASVLVGEYGYDYDEALVIELTRQRGSEPVHAEDIVRPVGQH